MKTFMQGYVGLNFNPTYSKHRPEHPECRVCRVCRVFSRLRRKNNTKKEAPRNISELLKKSLHTLHGLHKPRLSQTRTYEGLYPSAYIQPYMPGVIT